MLLKKTLTETKHPNPPAGYKAPETDDLQYTPVFSTKDIPSHIPNMPPEIKVHLQWRAQQEQLPNTATLQINDIVFQSAPIPSHATAIDFIYAGYSTYDQIEFAEGDIIHEFRFAYCPDDAYETRQARGDDWLIIPRDRLDLTGLNHRIFRPCGGTFFAQLYFALAAEGDATQLDVQPFSAIQQPALFTDGGNAISPAQAIVNGHLQLGSYQSAAYRLIDEHANLLEVTFIPRR